MWFKNLSIGSGTVAPALYEVLPKAFELVKSGRAKLSWIVTSQVSIEDAPEAYARFDKKLEIKVVIRFPWARQQQYLVDDEAVAGQETNGDQVHGHTAETRPIKLPV
jgi:hypothetical protein